ncbi:MAG: SIS domain-containing protein [candidate division KSB1 bacterium]|nr:SIS domain-containing protein [candidate division KSB1 bacterium]
MTNKNQTELPAEVAQFLKQHPDIVQIVIEAMERHPEFESVMPDLIRAYRLIVECFDAGGKLLLCGNGGSFADAMHIAGEMAKSFKRQRHLSPNDRSKFRDLTDGQVLADALEYGFPVIVLGLNSSLKSAIENDIPVPYIGYAQELFALGRPGDVLLGISTKGNAQNVLYAITTAKAIGMGTIGLTGDLGGKLARMADVAIRVPAQTTERIQEWHQIVYHALCAMVEAHYFKATK